MIYADLAGRDIVENSVIRADDINDKFLELQEKIRARGDSLGGETVTFQNSSGIDQDCNDLATCQIVSIGDVVSDEHIETQLLRLNNLSLVNILPTEVELGEDNNEINSQDINDAFNIALRALSQISTASIELPIENTERIRTQTSTVIFDSDENSAVSFGYGYSAGIFGGEVATATESIYLYGKESDWASCSGFELRPEDFFSNGGSIAFRAKDAPSSSDSSTEGPTFNRTTGRFGGGSINAINIIQNFFDDSHQAIAGWERGNPNRTKTIYFKEGPVGGDDCSGGASLNDLQRFDITYLRGEPTSRIAEASIGINNLYKTLISPATIDLSSIGTLGVDTGNGLLSNDFIVIGNNGPLGYFDQYGNCKISFSDWNSVQSNGGWSNVTVSYMHDPNAQNWWDSFCEIDLSNQSSPQMRIYHNYDFIAEGSQTTDTLSFLVSRLDNNLMTALNNAEQDPNIQNGVIIFEDGSFYSGDTDTTYTGGKYTHLGSVSLRMINDNSLVASGAELDMPIEYHSFDSGNGLETNRVSYNYIEQFSSLTGGIEPTNENALFLFTEESYATCSYVEVTERDIYRIRNCNSPDSGGQCEGSWDYNDESSCTSLQDGTGNQCSYDETRWLVYRAFDKTGVDSSTDNVTSAVQLQKSDNRFGTNGAVDFYQNFYEDNKSSIAGWDSAPNQNIYFMPSAPRLGYCTSPDSGGQCEGDGNPWFWEGECTGSQDASGNQCVWVQDSNEPVCDIPLEQLNYFTLNYSKGPGPGEVATTDVTINYTDTIKVTTQLGSLDLSSIGNLPVTPGVDDTDFILFGHAGPFNDFDQWGNCEISISDWNAMNKSNISVTYYHENFYQRPWDAGCGINLNDLNNPIIEVYHNFDFYNFDLGLPGFRSNNFGFLVTRVDSQLRQNMEDARNGAGFSIDYDTGSSNVNGTDYSTIFEHFGLVTINVVGSSTELAELSPLSFNETLNYERLNMDTGVEVALNLDSEPQEPNGDIGVLALGADFPTNGTYGTPDIPQYQYANLAYSKEMTLDLTSIFSQPGVAYINIYPDQFAYTDRWGQCDIDTWSDGPIETAGGNIDSPETMTSATLGTSLKLYYAESVLNTYSNSSDWSPYCRLQERRYDDAAGTEEPVLYIQQSLPQGNPITDFNKQLLIVGFNSSGLPVATQLIDINVNRDSSNRVLSMNNFFMVDNAGSWTFNMNPGGDLSFNGESIYWGTFYLDSGPSDYKVFNDGSISPPVLKKVSDNSIVAGYNNFKSTQLLNPDSDDLFTLDISSLTAGESYYWEITDYTNAVHTSSPFVVSSCTVGDVNAVSLDNGALSGLNISGNTDSCSFSCNTNYVYNESSNVCELDSVACTEQDVQSNGGNTNNATAYQGSVVGGDVSACLIADCNTYYNVAGDGKSCIAQSCTTQQDLTNNLGITNFTGLNTISGNYGTGCTYTCSSGYTVNSTDTTIACDLAPATMNFNIASYTNNTSTSVSISGTNQNEYKIWKGTSCTGEVVVDWTTSKPSSVSIYSLNAANGFSAKARNINNQESSCDNDTIIHDNILPVVNINSQSTSGNSHTVSWSITDANHDRTYYYLNNSLVSNTTSTSRNQSFSPLIFGTNEIRINPRDRANNQSNEIINVDNKPVPTNIQVLEGTEGTQLDITVRVTKYPSAGVKLYKDSSCTQLIQTSTANSSSTQNFTVTVGNEWITHTFYAKNYLGAEESVCSTATASFTAIEPVAGTRTCELSDVGFSSGDNAIFDYSATVYDDGRGNLSNNNCTISCIFGSNEAGSSPNKYCTTPSTVQEDSKVSIGSTSGSAQLDNIAFLKGNGEVDAIGNWPAPSSVSSGVIKVKSILNKGFVALKSNGTIVYWGDSSLTTDMSGITTTGVADIKSTYWNSALAILYTDGTVDTTSFGFNYTNANPDPVNNPAVALYSTNRSFLVVYQNGEYSHFGSSPYEYLSTSLNRPLVGVDAGDDYFILKAGQVGFSGYEYSTNYYKVLSTDTGTVPNAAGSNYYGFIAAGESYAYISNSTNFPITIKGNTNSTSGSSGSDIVINDPSIIDGSSFTDILTSTASFAMKKSSGEAWLFGNRYYGGVFSGTTYLTGVSKIKSSPIGFVVQYTNSDVEFFTRDTGGSATYVSRTQSPYFDYPARDIVATGNCFGVVTTQNNLKVWCRSAIGGSISFSSEGLFEIPNVSKAYSLGDGIIIKYTNNTYKYLPNQFSDQSTFVDPISVSGISDSGGIIEYQ